MHSPAGRARHEQRGPAVVFSFEALSHEQWRADCLPQEHLACWAQTQVSPLPQQVEGLATSVAIFEKRVVDGGKVWIFVWLVFELRVIESQELKLAWGFEKVRWLLRLAQRSELRRQTDVFVSDCHDRQWP